METGRDDTAVFCGGGVGVMVLLGFSRRLAKHFATFFDFTKKLAKIVQIGGHMGLNIQKV